MDDYELTRRMADGVKADLFRFGLSSAGVCFLLLSVVFLIGDGWPGYWRDLPWIIVFSLLFAVFFGGTAVEVALRNQLERVAKGEETLTVRFKSLEKEIERDKANEADRRQREKARRLHKLVWRTADIADELKISTDGKSALDWNVDRILATYIQPDETMRELRDITSHAKARLHEQDRPIVEADVEELLRMLSDAQQRIDAEMDSFIAKRDDP